MADEAVLAVQNWLNKTYTGIPGFEPAPTDGHTGCLDCIIKVTTQKM
ncbi:hypothetical protein [Lacticaseibacillus paracasei]|uniref:Uncharacterized protein n=1 Tax=Lacticaseibacillus paracasei (strain ATCC 334 / BCRC 17002 / CCUG 31169 / CIP 107868 / KCTC 3260 / NRRL B-441) TaxID=321967 RepID=Q03D12_LACP3|nr:hypothetical protein [Lacticaseibacillus paracasei]ABJ68910.1 hypothetical protein LSEI_0044 [Lacticaseibacillus paracasei ATCC 334]MDN5592006.1 hypothetical protein [Lacticaseibacillus paracasei]